MLRNKDWRWGKKQKMSKEKLWQSFRKLENYWSGHFKGYRKVWTCGSFIGIKTQVLQYVTLWLFYIFLKSFMSLCIDPELLWGIFFPCGCFLLFVASCFFWMIVFNFFTAASSQLQLCPDWTLLGLNQMMWCSVCLGGTRMDGWRTWRLLLLRHVLELQLRLSSSRKQLWPDLCPRLPTQSAPSCRHLDDDCTFLPKHPNFSTFKTKSEQFIDSKWPFLSLLSELLFG